MKYTFDDVLLKPQKCIVESRSEVDLTTQLAQDVWMDIPIVSAPMSSVTEWKMAAAMYKAGGCGFIHRFISIEDNIEQFQKAFKEASIEENQGVVPYDIPCTIGISEGYERLEKLYEEGCRIFCVDVAHAHSISMERFFSGIDNEISGGASFVVGNVATVEGALFLEALGVDAIKVGIGPGAACRTREVTGFGYPQLSAIQEIYVSLTVPKIPIIADGGIRNSGDIVKALAAGASSVMLGRLLAGTDEAPEPGKYYGMAATRVNGHRAPEGVEGDIEMSGPVEDILKELCHGIRSGISYGGGRDIYSLQDNAEFLHVSYGTQIESSVRI